MVLLLAEYSPVLLECDHYFNFIVTRIVLFPTFTFLLFCYPVRRSGLPYTPALFVMSGSSSISSLPVRLSSGLVLSLGLYNAQCPVTPLTMTLSSEITVWSRYPLVSCTVFSQAHLRDADFSHSSFIIMLSFLPFSSKFISSFSPSLPRLSPHRLRRLFLVFYLPLSSVADRITLMRIRLRIWILLLIKVIRICDHWSTDSQGFHFEPPRLHCKCSRPSTTPFLISKAPEF